MSDATGQPVTVRPARVDDVAAMASIVNDYAERGLMLHRSRAELYEHLRDFHVAEVGGPGDARPRVVGVVGLRVMWSNLAEVYGLAVSPDAYRRGIGRALVEAALADAGRLGVGRAFALTYERVFFERCGFEVVDRRSLPLKVWGECVRCPKHEACDEIAMVRRLREADEPAVDAGAPAYDVPAPRVTASVLRIDAAAAARGERDG